VAIDTLLTSMDDPNGVIFDPEYLRFDNLMNLNAQSPGGVRNRWGMLGHGKSGGFSGMEMEYTLFLNQCHQRKQ
jgi:hypothetical protein